MTRRERLERKAERRQEWAESASARAAQRFNAAHRIGAMIPLGQPILVGHHSEGHARRDQSRIETNMTKGCEEMHRAEYHAQKAEGLARQLDHSVFSDDANAIEALEARIAENEKTAETYKAINAAWRKGGAEAVRAAGFPESIASRAESTMRVCPWLKSPLDTTNVRARIRSDKERIEQLKRDAAHAEKVNASGGVLVECHGEYAHVTFSEKPDHDIIDALKAAGFRWSRPSWYGMAANLPECVTNS